jgi:hypothetical protein
MLGFCAIRSLALTALLLGGSGCVQATQRYVLSTPNEAQGAAGSVSVERIEGGERLVVVELDSLPPPEQLGPELRTFVVWVEATDGSRVKAGSLRYDRALRSGSLMATTALPSFTVRVTGERDENVDTPSAMVLAERKVSSN